MIITSPSFRLYIELYILMSSHETHVKWTNLPFVYITLQVFHCYLQASSPPAESQHPQVGALYRLTPWKLDCFSPYRHKSINILSLSLSLTCRASPHIISFARCVVVKTTELYIFRCGWWAHVVTLFIQTELKTGKDKKKKKEKETELDLRADTELKFRPVCFHTLCLRLLL